MLDRSGSGDSCEHKHHSDDILLFNQSCAQAKKIFVHITAFFLDEVKAIWP